MKNGTEAEIVQNINANLALIRSTWYPQPKITIKIGKMENSK